MRRLVRRTLLQAGLLTGLIAGLLVPPASGAPAVQAVRADAPQMSALRLLVEANDANRRQAYVGRQTVTLHSSDGDRSATVDVAHKSGGTIRCRVVPSAGAPGGYVLEPPVGASLLPVVNERTLAAVVARYTPRVVTSGDGANDKVAGRPTRLVELVRNSGSGEGSVAARIWLDRQTLLPLKRQVLDRGGSLLQSSAFTRINLSPTKAQLTDDDSAGPQRLAASPLLTADELGNAVPANRLGDLQKSGWRSAGVPIEGMQLVDVRVQTSSGEQVLHSSYSDGIATLSVFEQRGRLPSSAFPSWQKEKRNGVRVWVSQDVPERVVWSTHGHVYTLVSDDPAVAESAMNALPHQPEKRGFLQRLGHGAARVVSWFNPFS
jgi:hypothetical protein